MTLSRSQLQVIRDIKEFKRQVDDEEIEVRPDSSVKRQNDIAKLLGSDLDYFETKDEELQEKLNVLRREKQKAVRPDTEYVSAEEYMVPAEPNSPETDELLTELYECALGIREQITAARVHGMVHPTEELRKKYKQCMEDNAKLSNQILEYKTKLGLKK